MLASFMLGFAAGIAATPHCLGMCGGFPLHLAKGPEKRDVLSNQFAFLAGKMFTYIFLGALASTIGKILLKNTGLAQFTPLVRIAAGVITVVFGLAMLGVRLPKLSLSNNLAALDFLNRIYSGLVALPTPASSFSLGLLVGFLPCPLPIGMLAVAAASHDIPSGLLIMAGVGLGTMPGLLMAGLFGTALFRRWSVVGMRAAGIIVILIGMFTIARVTGVIHPTRAGHGAVPSCCGGIR
jgi:sulfite exporter TauE/SafE